MPGHVYGVLVPCDDVSAQSFLAVYSEDMPYVVEVEGLNDNHWEIQVRN